MASYTLYAPTLNLVQNAFVVNNGKGTLSIPYSISKFNTPADYNSVHIAISYQKSGVSAVKTTNLTSKAGIILDQPKQGYVVIDESMISGGWEIGTTYKIQIRLSKVKYSNTSDGLGQAAWLVQNGNQFSEWSTVVVAKAIGEVKITAPALADWDSSNKDTQNEILSINIPDTLIFKSYYSCEDISENLKVAMVSLYNGTSTVGVSGLTRQEPLQDYPFESFTVYPVADENNKTLITHKFKTEIAALNSYTIKVDIITQNNYKRSFYIRFIAVRSQADPVKAKIITMEDVQVNKHKHGNYDLSDFAAIELDNEEGRVGYQIIPNGDNPIYQGFLCVRRASEKTDFQIWEDLKTLAFKTESYDKYGVLYDYTAESGTTYKYAIQQIDMLGDRSSNISETQKIKRDFEYSYLLGKNNQQLKLKFNNTMNSFKYAVSDSKFETLGGKYAYITRNGNMKYRTFPITGLISIEADDQELFYNRQKIKTDTAMIPVVLDEYYQERLYREEVSSFLYDGEPKLFKSPTEGNILVRLTDISFTPEQSLGRLIYSFTATAYEIAEASFDNLVKYGIAEEIANIKDIDDDYFSRYSSFLGQINTFKDLTGYYQDGISGNNINLINLILNKYNRATSDTAIARQQREIIKISHVELEFNGYDVTSNNNNGMETITSYNRGMKYDDLLGYKIQVNGSTIFVPEFVGRYVFDENISFTPEDEIRIIIGDNDLSNGYISNVNVTINFVYECKIYAYMEENIESKTESKKYGQLINVFNYGDNIFKKIGEKYNYSYGKRYGKIKSINSMVIEANPGIIISIKDQNDADIENHVINSTGILVLSDLINYEAIFYSGKTEFYNSPNNLIQQDNILINYIAEIEEGIYKDKGGQL